MKLTYFQIENHLKKSLAGIYMLSGEEPFLKRETIRLIRAAAKKAGFQEKIRLSIETQDEIDQLYTSLYATSLFANKILIELDLRQQMPNSLAGKMLAAYADNPSSHHLLLINLGKLDTKINKSNWYQKLEKNGIAITFHPLSGEALRKWIKHRANQYRLPFNADAIHSLADYVEGNCTAAAQWIEKIYLLQPSKPIDPDFIQHILSDESQFTLFDFIENLIAGQSARALHILGVLKAEGVEPALFLWGITRELRLLASLSEQLANGIAYEKLWQKYAIFPRRQLIIRHFLSKFSAKDCYHYLMPMVEIDHLIKGAKKGDAWHALELYCLRML